MAFEYNLDAVAPYLAMQEAGANPVEVFKKAISDGVPRIYAISMMLHVCGLNISEASKAVREAENPDPDPGREAGG